MESSSNEYHLITDMAYSSRIAAFNVRNLRFERTVKERSRIIQLVMNVTVCITRPSDMVLCGRKKAGNEWGEKGGVRVE